MAKNEWTTIISGGICTSGTQVDLCSLDRVRVSSYHVVAGAVMRTGTMNTLYDMTIDGNLFASNTGIVKMTIPNGAVALCGSAGGSCVLVGGRLDCTCETTLTDLDIISGGKVAVQGSSFIRDVTVCQSGKLSMYGNARAHRMTISGGASVTLYGQAEANKVHVCSGGFLECWDDTHTSDVYVEDGAKFVCHDGAEVIYQRDSPQKPIEFGGASASCGLTDHGLDTIYRAKVTVSENGAVEIRLPVPLNKVFQGSGGLSVTWKGVDDDKR